FSLFSAPHNFELFLVSLALGALVNLYVYSLVGCIAFWTVNVWGIVSIYGRMADILGGSLFPLDFLPSKVGTLVGLLPFKYMHYAPISIYLGKADINAAFGIIGIQIFWVLVLSLLYKWVWGRGLKKYDAVGQ
ncbi:MAG: ABC-2 family transporter protein, partial [bacterium]